MKALIVGAGQSIAKERLERFYKTADLIIAADGGANYLQDLGLSPTHLIGDFDSIAPKTLQAFEDRSDVRRYSKEKNFTDLELAFDIAEELGAKEIFIFGWSDDRLDFSWSAILRSVRSSVPVRLINRDHSVYPMNETLSRLLITAEKPTRVSIYPVVTPISLSSRGLSWEVLWKTDKVSKSQSNVVENEAALSCEKGGCFVLIEDLADSLQVLRK